MAHREGARISFYVTFVAIALNVADSVHAAAENTKLLTGKAAMGIGQAMRLMSGAKLRCRICLRQARMLSQLNSRTL